MISKFCEQYLLEILKFKYLRLFFLFNKINKNLFYKLLAIYSFRVLMKDKLNLLTIMILVNIITQKPQSNNMEGQVVMTLQEKIMSV